jgi:hypothetical protein
MDPVSVQVHPMAEMESSAYLDKDSDKTKLDWKTCL